MIRILSEQETRDFLDRNPIDAADIPTWGLRIQDGGRDYVVALVHKTGQVKVMDVTTYDPASGERIDPAIADQSNISLWIDAILEGTVEGIETVFNWTPYVLLGGLALLAFYIYNEAQQHKRAA